MVIDYKKLEEAFYQFYKFLKEAWNKIKETFTSIYEKHNEHFKRQKVIQRTRSSWIINPDTRKQSQVISNKPKFMVRKVIR
jgi:hypothetical protein